MPAVHTTRWELKWSLCTLRIAVFQRLRRPLSRSLPAQLLPPLSPPLTLPLARHRSLPLFIPAVCGRALVVVSPFQLFLCTGTSSSSCCFRSAVRLSTSTGPLATHWTGRWMGRLPSAAGAVSRAPTPAPTASPRCELHDSFSHWPASPSRRVVVAAPG